MKALRRDLHRLLHLMRALVRHGLPAYLLHRRPGLRRRLAGPGAPDRLRTMLQQMGGSFVKLGQMLALQPDLIPPSYYLALQDLLDSVTPIDFEEVRRVILEETGRTPEQLFDRLEPEPLATASVAQVHVGTWHGRKVAVKVQRPGARTEFTSDLRWVLGLLAVIRRLRLRPLYWLREPLEEFVAWTREELDFRREAHYTRLLGRLADDNPLQVVPAVHGQLTARRLLVVDYLEGTMLLDYLRAAEPEDGAPPDEENLRRLEPPGFDRQKVAAHIIDNFIHDAFENGLYHADLHPANLLILPGSVIGYIDFGITGVINRHARRHLVTMTLALVTGNMELLHRQFLQLAAPDPRADPKRFRVGLEALARRWYGPDGSTLEVNFTRIMTDMLTLSRHSHVLPERDIVKYIRSSIAIDGLITRFAPGFDVSGHLAERCSRQRLADQRGRLWALPIWVDMASTGGRLLRGGPERLLALAQGLGDPPSPTGGGGGSAWVAPVSSAALIATASALAILWPPATPELGFNLWSAQILAIATASLWLVHYALTDDTSANRARTAHARPDDPGPAAAAAGPRHEPS